MFNDLPKLPGVYKFTNRLNSKIYIGKSVCLRKRIADYRYKTKKLLSQNPKERNYEMFFHKALVKYGIENFKIEVLEVFPSRTPFIETLILRREEFWIKIYNSTNKKIGYNILDGDQGLGHATTELTKRKISQANSGVKNGMYGKHGPKRLKVCKVDVLTFETLEIYDSLCEAALKNKVSVSHICDCVNGNRIKTGGFHWDKLLEGETEESSILRRSEYFAKRKIKKPQLWSEQQKINMSAKKKGKRSKNLKLIKVNQIDPSTGVVVRTFEAVIDAERYFNSSQKGLFNIRNHLCGRNKLAYGFKWEKVNP